MSDEIKKTSSEKSKTAKMDVAPNSSEKDLEKVDPVRRITKIVLIVCIVIFI